MNAVPISFFAVLLAACGGASDQSGAVTEPATLAGTWAMRAAQPGVVLTFSLNQSGASVSGTGHYAVEAGPAGSVDVAGNARPDGATLTLHYADGRSASFEAQLSATNQLTGTEIFADGTSLLLTLVKQGSS
jgi:hypothetical protein